MIISKTIRLKITKTNTAIFSTQEFNKIVLAIVYVLIYNSRAHKFKEIKI